MSIVDNIACYFQTMNEGCRLSEVDTGKSVFIENVKGKGAFRQRISEMGFVKGKKVTVVKNAPLNDPIEFSIMGYNISLRRKEASLIEVTPGFLSVQHEEQLTTDLLSDTQPCS